MNLYSGNGDDGTTHILKAGKISKGDMIIETLGILDEASASIAMANLSITNEEISNILTRILEDLAEIMTDVAGDQGKKPFEKDCLDWMESQIEIFSEGLKLPKGFIYTYIKESSARLNFARTIIRKAERRMVALFEKREMNNKEILAYLNRLSSLIYLLQIRQEMT